MFQFEILKMAQSPAAMKLKILAFVGSVREGRMAERVINHLKKLYSDQSDGHTFEVIGMLSS